MEGTHAGAVHEELEAHKNDICWRCSWRTASHGRGPILEQRKSVRSPNLEKEGVTETTCDDLIPTPCTTRWEKVENSGVKLSPRRGRGREKGVFKIWLSLSLSYSDLIGNELN